jgi:hypothetical protein
MFRNFTLEIEKKKALLLQNLKEFLQKKRFFFAEFGAISCREETFAFLQKMRPKIK